MGSDAWIVGDFCRPLIEVVHPVTRERLPISAFPQVTLIDPDGDTTPLAVTHDSEVIGGYEAPFELTKVGQYLGVVESPAPYKDVASFTLYANPPG
jgi:hypothetical protein